MILDPMKTTFSQDNSLLLDKVIAAILTIYKNNIVFETFSKKGLEETRQNH